MRYRRDQENEIGEDIRGGRGASYRIKTPDDSPNPGVWRESIKYDDIDIGQQGPAAEGSNQELADIPEY